VFSGNDRFTTTQKSHYRVRILKADKGSGSRPQLLIVEDTNFSNSCSNPLTVGAQDLPHLDMKETLPSVQLCKGDRAYPMPHVRETYFKKSNECSNQPSG
jgi:hypothetical protein